MDELKNETVEETTSTITKEVSVENTEDAQGNTLAQAVMHERNIEKVTVWMCHRQLSLTLLLT